MKRSVFIVLASLNVLWPISGSLLVTALKDQPRKEVIEVEVPEDYMWPDKPYKEKEIPPYNPPTEPIDLPQILEPSPLTPQYTPSPPTLPDEPSPTPTEVLNLQRMILNPQINQNQLLQRMNDGY